MSGVRTGAVRVPGNCLAGFVGVVRARLRVMGGPERGSAVVEFLGVSLLLLVPIVYLVLTLAQIQAAAFAAEGAAREAGRLLARAESLQEGAAAARLAVELAFEDQGLDVDGAGALQVSCTEEPCLAPGTRVVVTVATSVDLPLVPDVVVNAVPATVPVSATHVAAVPEFRAAR
ncbi:pilus assembly protein [Georgenia daeguensis]|uniref:Pilus assembly protein n=1 Tax=Georgenia daeguensis TaxID=908355 RepID=A0ABP8EV21_9MICO